MSPFDARLLDPIRVDEGPHGLDAEANADPLRPGLVFTPHGRGDVGA